MKAALLTYLTLLATPIAAQTIGAVHRFVPVSDDIIVAMPRYGGANSTIVINSDHVLVVDAQGSVAAADVLIDEIARLTPLPVRTVVNTHWHGDHHGGNAAFRAAFPDVEIIAHPRTALGIRESANREIHGVAPFLRQMLTPGEAALESKTQDGVPMSAAAVEQLENYLQREIAFLENVPADYRYDLPDRLLSRALMYNDGARLISIFYPGRAHTDGDLVVRLRNDDVTIVGDLITVPYVVPRSGFPRSYARVIGQLGGRFDGTIVPGHGLPGAHDELISSMSELMLAVADFVQERIDAGASDESITAAASTDPDLSAFGARIEWDAEEGMQFLDFGSLIGMTVDRAIVEARGN